MLACLHLRGMLRDGDGEEDVGSTSGHQWTSLKRHTILIAEKSQLHPLIWFLLRGDGEFEYTQLELMQRRVTLMYLVALDLRK